MTKASDDAAAAVRHQRSKVVSSNTRVTYDKDTQQSKLYLHGHLICVRDHGPSPCLRVTFAGWPTRTTLSRLSEVWRPLALCRLWGDAPGEYTPILHGVPFPASAWLQLPTHSGDVPLLWLPDRSREELVAYTEEQCAPLYARWLQACPRDTLKLLTEQWYRRQVEPDGLGSAHGGRLLSRATMDDLLIKEVQRRGPRLNRTKHI